MNTSEQMTTDGSPSRISLQITPLQSERIYMVADALGIPVDLVPCVALGLGVALLSEQSCKGHVLESLSRKLGQNQ